MPVQVNGKVRARLTVPAGRRDDALRELALADPQVVKHLEGKTVGKSSSPADGSRAGQHRRELMMTQSTRASRAASFWSSRAPTLLGLRLLARRPRARSCRRTSRSSACRCSSTTRRSSRSRRGSPRRCRSELIGRGKYKVEPDRTGVDAVLLGEISSITLAPAASTISSRRRATSLTARRQDRVPRREDRQGAVVEPGAGSSARSTTSRTTPDGDRPERVPRPGRQRARRLASEFARTHRQRHPRSVLSVARPATPSRPSASRSPQGKPDPST